MGEVVMADVQTHDTKSANGGGEVRCNEVMLQLRKYLLLLAILAATVTYAAGLNPPGGVWLDSQGGHLTGNQILVVTYHRRYNAFSYSNATAFMASAVVILILVFGFKDKQSNIINGAYLFFVLRVVMVLDLLALVVAYAAGASRDMLTTVLASLLVSPILLYVLVHAVKKGTFLFRGTGHKDSEEDCLSCRGTCSDKKILEAILEDKRRRKILMLLAIFATTITYTAGLNPPGGFWPDTQEEQNGGHRAGDPVLQHHHRLRFAVFFVCNTISFVASLFVIMLLLTNRFVISLFGNSRASKAKAVPYVSMAISLLGLLGAYAAGSCRERDSTVGVVVLYVLGSMLALVCFGFLKLQKGNHKEGPPNETKVKVGHPGLINKAPSLVLKKAEGGHRGGPGLINTAPTLVLLLATLAATVTYQAGLNPPGGFWPDNRDGHKGGDPILVSKHAARYRLFFYCNSTALAASLVVIFMVLRNYLSTRGIKNNGSVPDEQKGRTGVGHHIVILELVMILDLIGLIGAFAAGCCRDVSTSIYVIALAGGTLVYVVFHIVFFTLHRNDLHQDEGGDVEEKRKLLLLLAILAVTLTYQAGLTPPGGFWLGDDSEAGHHAGDPVLLSNYPRRYTAFFYLNATGFMASVALTILLVNPNLYRAGIKCCALHVCMVAALFGLMGAYAAGSSRHVRTSIYMISLILLVFTFVVIVLLLVFSKRDLIQNWLSKDCKKCQAKDGGKQSSRGTGHMEASSSLSPREEAGDNSTKPGEGTGNMEASSSLPSTEEAGQNGTKPGEDKGNMEASSSLPSTEEAGHNSTKPGEGTGNMEASSSAEEAGGIKLHTKRRYLMLLGILAASVTYQAGLAPPGGFWPDNNDGHAVGNPVLRDSSHHRYLMFFCCNSATFVASVVVITLQLLVNFTSTEKNCEANNKLLVQTAQWMMALDLVCLLLAYAAGSTREWETSCYFVLLLVVFGIGIGLLVSCFGKQWRCSYKSCVGQGEGCYHR